MLSTETESDSAALEEVSPISEGVGATRGARKVAELGCSMRVPGAPAPEGNRLEVQMLRPRPDLLHQKLWAVHQALQVILMQA